MVVAEGSTGNAEVLSIVCWLAIISSSSSVAFFRFPFSAYSRKNRISLGMGFTRRHCVSVTKWWPPFEVFLNTATRECLPSFIIARPLDVKTVSTNTASTLEMGVCLLWSLDPCGDWLVVVVNVKLACCETVHAVSLLHWLDVRRVETVLDWSANIKVFLAGICDFQLKFVFQNISF